MQNGMIDLYVRGNNSVAYSEIYSSFASEKNSYISDLLLLVINNDSSKVRKHGETYEVAGVRFTADQIPKIDTNKLLEIKLISDRIITSNMFLQTEKSMHYLQMTRVLWGSLLGTYAGSRA